MRVFVLSTGRCGSMTFTRACQHLTNYTSGHESRAERIGDDRFAYPDAHIESDNRLAWMLGELDWRFEPSQTLWVHLIRDPEQVARSFARRWNPAAKAGIITAFAHAIVMHPRDWDEGARLEVCRFYVDVVNRNIAQFIRHQPNSTTVHLERAKSDFPRVLARIGAEGDLEAAVREWETAHNAST